MKQGRRWQEAGRKLGGGCEQACALIVGYCLYMHNVPCALLMLGVCAAGNGGVLRARGLQLR